MSRSSGPRIAGEARRLLHVGLAVVIGVSLVGFAVGTRTMSPTVPAASTSNRSAGPGAAPSVPYRVLRQRRYGPNSAVTSDLAMLRRGFSARTDPVARATAAQRREALARRDRRRAYGGAPPVIPHPIDQKSAGACLACHRDGIRIEGRVASPISHDELANCTQCHVTAADQQRAAGQQRAAALEVSNTFAGVGSAGEGRRAWPGAPPTMPHRQWMRQRCDSCHGVAGAPGLRTTHPQRQNCLQCHAQSRAQIPGAPYDRSTR